jgi:hypothetical protein
MIQHTVRIKNIRRQVTGSNFNGKVKVARQVTVTKLLGAFSDKVLLEIRFFFGIILLVVKMVLFLKSPNAGLVFNQTLKINVSSKELLVGNCISKKRS